MGHYGHHLLSHSGKHQTRCAREGIWRWWATQGVHVLHVQHVKNYVKEIVVKSSKLFSMLNINSPYHSLFQQFLDPGLVAHGAGLQEAHDVSRGPVQPRHQLRVEVPRDVGDAPACPIILKNHLRDWWQRKESVSGQLTLYLFLRRYTARSPQAAVTRESFKTVVTLCRLYIQSRVYIVEVYPFVFSHTP